MGFKGKGNSLVCVRVSTSHVYIKVHSTKQSEENAPVNKAANKGVYVSHYIEFRMQGANTLNNWAIVPGATKPKVEAATQTSEAFVSQSRTGQVPFALSFSFTKKHFV